MMKTRAFAFISLFSIVFSVFQALGWASPVSPVDGDSIALVGDRKYLSGQQMQGFTQQLMDGYEEAQKTKNAQDNRSATFDGTEKKDPGAVNSTPLPGAKEQFPNLPDFKKDSPKKPAVPGKIDGNLFKSIVKAIGDIEWNSRAGASIAGAVGAGLGYLFLASPIGLYSLLVGAVAGLIYWAIFRD